MHVIHTGLSGSCLQAMDSLFRSPVSLRCADLLLKKNKCGWFVRAAIGTTDLNKQSVKINCFCWRFLALFADDFLSTTCPGQMQFNRANKKTGHTFFSPAKTYLCPTQKNSGCKRAAEEKTTRFPSKRRLLHPRWIGRSGNVAWV